LKCLHLKEEEIPEGNWYCKKCIPLVEKRKELEEEKKRKMERRLKEIEERRD
jgi:hypothetical protein